MSNPLLSINWSDVRMIGIIPETATVQIILSEGDPLKFKFNSREEMDRAYFEWVRDNDPLLKT